MIQGPRYPCYSISFFLHSHFDDLIVGCNGTDSCDRVVVDTGEEASGTMRDRSKVERMTIRYRNFREAAASLGHATATPFAPRAYFIPSWLSAPIPPAAPLKLSVRTPAAPVADGIVQGRGAR
jgi:hypothetical protein